MIKRISKALLTAGMLLTISTAWASSGAIPLKEIEIDRSQETLKKGFTHVYNTCMRCHSLDYIKYRNLMEIGYSKAEVDALRGEKGMGDILKSTMPDEASMFHFGKIPPDLSLMAKARKHGPNYIYTLLTSYHAKEDGSVDNQLFPGIRMPDILAWTKFTAEADRADREKMMKEVVAFLEWAADPRAQERRDLGVWVIGYFILLSILMYFVKRRTWSDVH